MKIWDTDQNTAADQNEERGPSRARRSFFEKRSGCDRIVCEERAESKKTTPCGKRADSGPEQGKTTRSGARKKS